MFHIAYPSASEALKTDLRAIYNQLCQDDMPMVRRSAATNLGKFAATIEPAHLKTDIITIFEDLTQDGEYLLYASTNLIYFYNLTAWVLHLLDWLCNYTLSICFS